MKGALSHPVSEFECDSVDLDLDKLLVKQLNNFFINCAIGFAQIWQYPSMYVVQCKFSPDSYYLLGLVDSGVQ